MKMVTRSLRIVLILILIMPVLGSFGIFPPPTPDMYNTPEAFAFIDMLMTGKYINWLVAIVFAGTIVLTVMNRMAAAALLMLPVVVNIIGFHLFLDGGLFTAGAIMGNVLALINIYFLWINRAAYRALLIKQA